MSLNYDIIGPRLPQNSYLKFTPNHQNNPVFLRSDFLFFDYLLCSNSVDTNSIINGTTIPVLTTTDGCCTSTIYSSSLYMAALSPLLKEALISIQEESEVVIIFEEHKPSVLMSMIDLIAGKSINMNGNLAQEVACLFRDLQIQAQIDLIDHDFALNSSIRNYHNDKIAHVSLTGRSEHQINTGNNISKCIPKKRSLSPSYDDPYSETEAKEMQPVVPTNISYTEAPVFPINGTYFENNINTYTSNAVSQLITPIQSLGGGVYHQIPSTINVLPLSVQNIDMSRYEVDYQNYVNVESQHSLSSTDQDMFDKVPIPRVGSPCRSNCRFQCPSNISHARRCELNRQFWNLKKYKDRRQWILVHCRRGEEKLMNKRKRSANIDYSLPLNDETSIRVCASFFLKTLGLKAKNDRMVRTALNGLERGPRPKRVPVNKADDVSMTQHILMYYNHSESSLSTTTMTPRQIVGIIGTSPRKDLKVAHMHRDYCEKFSSAKVSYDTYRRVFRRICAIKC